jgi:hypothetical protein
LSERKFRIKILDGIVDSLHETKKLFTFLSKNEQEHSVEAFLIAKINLASLLQATIDLQEKAKTATDLKLFAGSGILCLKFFACMFGAGSLGIFAVHWFDPMALTQTSLTMISFSQVPLNLLVILCVSSLVASIGPLLAFCDHFRDCWRGSRPALMNADKRAIATARSALEAARATLDEAAARTAAMEAAELSQQAA